MEAISKENGKPIKSKLKQYQTKMGSGQNEKQNNIKQKWEAYKMKNKTICEKGEK